MHLWFLVRSHVRRQHVNNVLKQTFLRRFNSDTPKQPEKKTNQWIRPENLTIPNMITVSRIISSPILGWAIMNDQKELAFGGCIIFGFSDWLDGYLAKKLNQRTVLGAFLDPFADKCMIGSLAVGLMYKGLLPVELVGLMIGRDACLIISSFAYRTLYKPPDVEFFDTSNTTNFVVEPSVLSKVSPFPSLLVFPPLYPYLFFLF